MKEKDVSIAYAVATAIIFGLIFILPANFHFMKAAACGGGIFLFCRFLKEITSIKI